MGGGTQVSTSSTAPWKGQQKYLLKGFHKAEDMFNKTPEYYPGETLAGFDPAQTAAQQAVMGYATGPRTAGMQAGAESALMGAMAGKTPFSGGQMSDLLAGKVDTGQGSPYAAMENALVQGTMSNLQGKILPGLRDQQMAYQPGGSSRGVLEQNKAISKAVASGLTKPLAQMYRDAYSTAQGMRLPAAQMGIGQQQYGMSQYPTIMGAPMGMYKAMGDVGAQRRAMSQESINRDMARYQYQSTAPQQQLANYMNMVQGNYGGETVQTTPGQSALSSIGQMASIVKMFSDSRVKENLIPDGSWRGLNIYKFNYIGDGVQRRGVLAQDVEKLYPHAVSEEHGIKMVDYGAI